MEPNEVAEANRLIDQNLKSNESGTVQEHRDAHLWLREKRYSEREILLQIHSVLIDVLGELRGKKK
jgi:hypothetical protein